MSGEQWWIGRSGSVARKPEAVHIVRLYAHGMDLSVSGVGVIDKAMAIVRAIEAEPRTLADLVTDTGIQRATCHRLATALEKHGALRRDEHGRFELGPSFIGLGRLAEQRLPLAAQAGPVLDRLRDRTGESTQLYVRERSIRRCVAGAESQHGLRTIVPVGAALSMDAGSAAAVLRDDADLVGSVEEREPGVASVSAAVRDPAGRVIAAISVSGPIDRMTRDPRGRFGPSVQQAARALEQLV